jgi:C4-dicarboxylate transporter DctQ subunit
LAACVSALRSSLWEGPVLRAVANRVEEGLIVAILGAMTLLTFIQVGLRYLFNIGILWALEADFYLFSWLVMIGMSYCVRARAHIGVDAAIKLLPPRAQRVAGLLVVALTLVYAGLMLYGSMVYVDRMKIIDVEAEDIPVKRWILSLCLPIGFALLSVRLAEMGWRIAIGRSPGYELADEAKEAIKDITGDHIPDATTISR